MARPCPRCGRLLKDQRYYGPCEACGAELRNNANSQAAWRRVLWALFQKRKQDDG